MKLFKSELNEDEKIQLQWMKHNQITDKDRERLAAAPKEQGKSSRKYKNRPRSPASWNFPIPEEEIDLHGFVAGEAASAVENILKGMERGGLSVLRIIHGGGRPEYGNVKRIIDRAVRTIWKQKISFYKTEPDNAGSSILKIKLSSTPSSTIKLKRKK